MRNINRMHVKLDGQVKSNISLYCVLFGSCERSHIAYCNCVGLNVSEKSGKALLMRYSDKNGNITFNDFVACYVKLKTMLSMCFQWMLIC